MTHAIKARLRWRIQDRHRIRQDRMFLLELMIPPTKRPGSVVVTRPTSHGEVPGSNPGLVVLFSLTVPDHLNAESYH